MNCLHQQMKQQNRATETAQEVNLAFRIGLRRLVQLRAECEGLNQYIKELNLADYGLDARYDLCVVCGEEKARTRGGGGDGEEREREGGEGRMQWE